MFAAEWITIPGSGNRCCGQVPPDTIPGLRARNVTPLDWKNDMKTREAHGPVCWIRVSPLLLVAAMGVGCSFRPANQVAGSGSAGSGGSSGSAGSGGTGSQIATALAITPLTATLTVSGGGPAQTQQYTVMGTVNGASVDLTTQVAYSAVPAGIVTIDHNGLATTTGTAGGIVTITASTSQLAVTAKLTVVYSFTGPDPMMTGTVPSDAATRFTSTTNDTTRSPQLIYPNDGVLFPPNISSVEIHFMPGANNTLFEVSFTGPLSTVNSFIRCTAPAGITGCIYLPDPGLWASVATSNAGQGLVQLVVRGTDDTGTSVGASSTFNMQFSKDAVRGALYYWTTSNKTAIMRYDFGGSTTAPAPYLVPAAAGASIACVGCHGLAPNGQKLVASANGQGDGRLLLWDITNNVALQPFPLAQRSQFESWNKDSTQFVGVFGDNPSGSNSARKGASNLMIFDGTSGAVTQTIDLMGLRADHPDWSKNTSGAETIAFTSVDATATTTDQRPSTGGIDFIQLTAGTWGAPQMLVPAMLGQNNYYPAISPDGNLVVYDQSTCTAGTAALGKAPDKSCDADTDATATMFLTSLTAGATSVALASANGPGVADGTNTTLTNSFPKWAPFIENLDELNKVLWLTFSSTRQYGLRTPPKPATTDETTIGTLIWMVGIRQGVGGADPSYTAFCLPFQDITTSNHIAQWAQNFVVGPPS
jgi:hypothetical protein